jgi:pimeloyl-ACP methyl ester carboxylesterase
MKRRIRTAAAAIGIAAAIGAHPSAAAGDQPGPQLTVPRAKLASALKCYGPVERNGRQPVLLLPAAQRTPRANWEGGYVEALALNGRVACAVPLVDNGAGDIQESAEYVVYAVRELARRSGRRIAIVGHSQGGFAAVWALRFWPDLAAHVSDVVSFGTAYRGVWVARTTCDLRRECEPGSWQVAYGSNFVAALNRDDPTRDATAYTSIYSDTDEFTRPPRAVTRLRGAKQIGIQEVCAGRPVEHLQESDDAVTFAIVLDAIGHAGPAHIERISTDVCMATTQPGYDPAVRAAALTDGGPGRAPSTTDHEPPVRCYARADC